MNWRLYFWIVRSHIWARMLGRQFLILGEGLDIEEWTNTPEGYQVCIVTAAQLEELIDVCAANGQREELLKPQRMLHAMTAQPFHGFLE
jgi:hypothetical protein